MSATTVHNAILNQLWGDTNIDAEFSFTLTGTASSSSTTVTGTGTLFTSELKIGDYVGKPSKGYRKVTAIATDTSLTVETAFTTNLSAESIKKTEIRRGFGKEANLTEVGKILRIAYGSSADIDNALVGNKVLAVYGFLIAIGFYEPDDELSESRKASYDKMIRDAIDKDPTFGNVCIGNTEMDKFEVMENPGVDGIYYGAMPLVCFKYEIRGNR